MEARIYYVFLNSVDIFVLVNNLPAVTQTVIFVTWNSAEILVCSSSFVCSYSLFCIGVVLELAIDLGGVCSWNLGCPALALSGITPVLFSGCGCPELCPLILRQARVKFCIRILATYCIVVV